MIGVFCEVFGDNVRNRVIENLLIFDEIGIAIPDLADESGISKQRAYQIMYNFEKKDMVKRHRIIGKTQLWVVNEKNSVIQIFHIALKECIKRVAEQYKDKHPSLTKTKQKILAK